MVGRYSANKAFLTHENLAFNLKPPAENSINFPFDSKFEWNRDHIYKGVLMVSGPGGAQLYMGYIGMCRCEGYGFQAVYSRIGYINQSVWV